MRKSVSAKAIEPASTLSFVEELKRQWVATIDALVHPLMIVDSTYTVSKANRAMAKMSGKDVKEILGQKCYQVFADRKSPCPGCGLKLTETSKKASTFHLENIRGEQIYEATAQPIVGDNNTLDGVVVIYHDRTEARKIEERLRQNDKLSSIGMLAGGIAHEINNPLGGILIFSQMLLREMDKASPHYQDVVEIEAATQRCKEIVTSLLDFARMQPSRSDKTKQDQFDIIEAIQTAKRFAMVAPNSRKVEVREKFPKNGLPITGNRNKVIQVLLNIMQNAIQAMPGGGVLHLKASESEHNGSPAALVEIRDTGIGIPSEIQDKIFDPFFTTKEQGQGTGLGLAICFGIIEEMGGTIELSSKVNKGTTFRIFFPKGETL
jgi:two-component system, NtrC family, sensor kinase